MSRGTPGPWFAEDKPRGKYSDAGVGVIASDDECRISNPSRGIVAWVTRRVGQKNSEVMANARLIAAAPDMQEALEAHVEAHGKSRLAAAGFYDTPGDADRAHDRAMAMTYRALAKAGDPT